MFYPACGIVKAVGSECCEGNGGSTNDGCSGSLERLLAAEEEFSFVDLVS